MASFHANPHESRGRRSRLRSVPGPDAAAPCCRTGCATCPRSCAGTPSAGSSNRPRSSCASARRRPSWVAPRPTGRARTGCGCRARSATTRCCTRRCSRTPATTCCSTWPSARTRSAVRPRRFTGFSLDHTLWLHRPVRFDRWHLHTQETLAISGHRGLVRGAIHDTDGHLVASVVQEVLVRPRGTVTPSMTSLEHRLFQQPWPEGEYRLFQLGFVVDDVLADGGALGTTSTASGPSTCSRRSRPRAPITAPRRRSRCRSRVAQAGPVQIELIQQLCDRPSVYRDLVDTGESGFHQLCTVTADYDGKIAHYQHARVRARDRNGRQRSTPRVRRHRRRLRLLHRDRRGDAGIPREPGHGSRRPAPSGTAPIPSASSPATATAPPSSQVSSGAVPRRNTMRTPARP